MNILKSEITSEKSPYKSIIELVIKRLKTDPDKGCIIDCNLNRRCNKRQVLESSLNFAYYLITECEVKNGDTILFVKNNSDSHAIAMIGVLAAGAVYCSLAEHTTEREIKDVSFTINPTTIICSPNKYELVRMATSDISSVKKILAIEEQMDKENNNLTFDKIFNNKREPTFALPRASDLEDTAFLAMSSGSTGRPKAIMRTNKNILYELASMQHPEICPLTEQDIFLSNGLCHSCGQSMWLACINTGAQLAINTIDEDHEPTFEAIHKYNITTAFFVPNQLNYLLRNREVYNKAYIKSLRNLFCGGAHLSKDVHDSIVDLFNLDNFRITYGMSEIGFAVVVPKKDAKCLGNVTTIGKLYPGFQAKVIDPNGDALGPTIPGELCFKGDQVTPGYLNNKDENAKLFTHDHFLKSGDICYYDEYGFIYLIGRSKEIINVEGVVVVPAELESILLQREEIENAAVIGIKDEEYDEIPLAFVKLSEGSSMSSLEIEQYVDSKVNYYKKLRGGVRIVDRFPLTSLKKINKAELKKLVANSI